MKELGIYLIPVTLGDTPHERVLPAYNGELLLQLKHFVVENVRTARRFLKKAHPDLAIDELQFYVLDKRTTREELLRFLQPLEEGQSLGLLSEAGCPAIADPGADLVRVAQERGYRVFPLVGPSSILLSLMASGFNGQRFAFVGYLPVEKEARARSLKEMEQRVYSHDETQIFIETPYRNNQLMEDIVQLGRGTTRLCVAANITTEQECIRTRSLREWKGHLPNLHKQPCIFLLYK